MNSEQKIANNTALSLCSTLDILLVIARGDTATDEVLQQAFDRTLLVASKINEIICERKLAEEEVIGDE